MKVERNSQNQETAQVDFEALAKAIGIKKAVTVEAYDVKALENILKKWVKEEEPAVLITRHECALLPSQRKRYLPLEVNTEICNGCTLCLRIGCPSISKSEQLDPKYGRPLAKIDPLLCTGCEICAQICPRDAILFREQVIARQAEKVEVKS